MAFETRKIDPARIGEIITKRREELHIEIKEVSRELKIPVRYLEAIEEGMYHTLPAPIYVKSFFKKYATFLGLDISELTSDLDRELEVSRTLFSDSPPVITGNRISKKGNQFRGISLITPAGIRIAIILIFFLTVGGYIVYQLDGIFRSPEIRLTEPDQDISSTKDEFIEMSGKTAKESRLTINGKDVYVDEEGSFRERFSLTNGINTFTLEAETRFTKTKTVKVVTIFKEVSFQLIEPMTEPIREEEPSEEFPTS